MAKAYSCDLRRRVLAHYERHQCATLTSQVFNISRSIIYDWKKIKTATGDIKPKENYQRGHGHKIKDLDKFKEIVKANSGLTLEKIVEKSGIEMSVMTCSRALQKLNITRKKRPMDIKSATKRKGKHSLINYRHTIKKT
jgi:transposase